MTLDLADEVSGDLIMDFSVALQAHANWKLKLAAFCKGVLPEKLDPQVIARDNACDLGKWLHSDGRVYATEPQFKTLINEHAAFHRAAAHIARLVMDGHRADAEPLINSPDSDFCIHSRKVATDLMALRRKFENLEPRHSGR